MGRPRTPVTELELTGSNKVSRALSYAPKPSLKHRRELEAMFSDLIERRAALLVDIRQRGLVFQEDRFNNNKLYRATIQHPGLKALQATERQIVSLAKVLTSTAVASEPETTTDIARELDEILGGSDEQPRRSN